MRWRHSLLSLLLRVKLSFSWLRSVIINYTFLKVVMLWDTFLTCLFTGFTDWFDGLQTFMRYICHKSWLGGWLMPQKKSYFALQLPKGWWVFGLDLALHCDIDVYQFKFFAELIKEKVKSYHICYWSFINRVLFRLFNTIVIPSQNKCSQWKGQSVLETFNHYPF